MTEAFYVQGTDASRERFAGRHPVSFEWNIVYDCNFRCPHCIFAGKWDEYRPRTRFLSVGEWTAVWERLHRAHGAASILITGGEPFVYPGFIDIVTSLSRLHAPINISTNASGDLAAAVRAWDPSRVSLTFSFQPGFNTLADVMRRMAFITAQGFARTTINFCAYPPYLADLERYVAQAREAGETLKIVPFYGEYAGVRYPDGYTADQRRLLGLDTQWEQNVKRKGKYCKAGMETALIYPDGKVARCGQVGERVLVGSIFDERFSLFPRPMPCDVDLCPCLEADLSEQSHD